MNLVIVLGDVHYYQCHVLGRIVAFGHGWDPTAKGWACTATIAGVLIVGHDRFPTYYGTEFVSKAMDVWAYQHGVQLDFIRPGRPVENSYIESFNGRLRDECLNVEVFFTLADVREKLERWREDYNQVRPHSALNDQSPRTFATTWAPSAASASTSWPANYTLAGVVRSAAAANPEPRQPFVRPSAAVKGTAEKLVSEGTSNDGHPNVWREVLT